MRICQVMAGDEEGGLETHFADLANGLAVLGDSITVIAHERYRDRFAPGVAFLELDLTRGRRNPWLRRHLRRLIESIDPDVVHAHAGKAAALVAAIAPRCRTVGTVHGLKKDLSAYRRFDAVIGVSRGVIEGLEHPGKTVVYNGVGAGPEPTTRIALRRMFGTPADGPVTLAVGRLVPVKGYDRLIDLWQDCPGHLLIAGDGPDRARLEGMARGKPVILTGFRSDVRSLMGGADLMVFASQREGLSYALAEALIARLPVVSTRVAGAEELLPESHLADIGELAHAITRCLHDPQAARTRMRDAFDWAAHALTVERMVRSTRAVYAGEGRRGRRERKRMMLRLHELEPFAIGGTRRCYVHPDDETRCVKVLRADRTPEARRALASGWRRFKRLESFDDQRKETKAYRHLRRRSSARLHARFRASTAPSKPIRASAS